MLLEAHVEQELKSTEGVVSVEYEEHDEHGLMVVIAVRDIAQLTKTCIQLLLEEYGRTFFSNVHQAFRPHHSSDDSEQRFLFFRFEVLTHEKMDLTQTVQNPESQPADQRAAA